jgi:hypothetical protein
MPNDSVQFAFGLMSVWFRRLLLILTIGGGFLGLAVTLQFLPSASKVITYFMLFAFIGLYAYGIFVGLTLSEGPVPIKHLRFYFALQIPFISSPLIVYGFCSGLQATVAILQSGPAWGWRLGSQWQFALFSSAPWGCGVNLIALIMVFVLYSPVIHARDEISPTA